MTAQILSSELSSLIQESKRKLPELRNAAEKSLQELKSLPITSEAQLNGDLSRRPHFIDPFLIACSSRNPKYAGLGISCLQRLATSVGLPRSRLKEVLEAIKECSGLALEVQLKILQTLPALLQNYPEDVRGGLLFVLLQVCSILQASKAPSISSTAAATLQQLVSALFERLGDEDRRALELPTVAEVPGEAGPVPVRPVAYDAARVLQDICLLTEGNKPQHIRFSPMPETVSLELIETILVSHSELISTHSELAYTIRSTLLPFLIKAFAEKRTFAVTVRVTRLLYLIVRNHIQIFTKESELVLESFNHVLEQGDSIPSWKKVLCMEVFRGIFAETRLILHIYSAYDNNPKGKSIIRTCTAGFVRLASEKPALIGLSQQSTVPVGNYFQRESGVDTTSDSGSITSGHEGTAGVGTSAVPGISNQWSSVRAPCIDQLDKSEAPSLPETYIYTLVLACLNNLAEGLAKFILPLTVQQSSKTKKRSKNPDAGDDEPSSPSLESIAQPPPKEKFKRTHSLKKKIVPTNPLLLEGHPAYNEIQSAAALIDQCWPAILASCSTFFYASLDSDHYRALVRSFQKFAQVAGLLRMSTPRDAFLTTLGKAAVPPHVLAGTFSSPSAQSMQSPSASKGLLNVESLVSQASTLLPDRGRRGSLDAGEPTLSSRNLLCLRALLNLAIALGPTLESSWSIVFETLQQADKVMAGANLRPVSRDSRSGMQTPTVTTGEPPQLQVIASEVNAIQSAASRLFESTVDFPNDSFVQVLRSLCQFIEIKQSQDKDIQASPPPTPGGQHRRISSFSGVSMKVDTTDKDFVFALSKIRELVSGNVERFITNDPKDSGWDIFTSTVISVATYTENPSTARLLAAELLSRLVRDTVTFASDEEQSKQDEVQCRALSAVLILCRGVAQRYSRAQSPDETANEVHSIAFETLRAILEQTGHSLTNGWGIVFDIILSVFVSVSKEPEASQKHQTVPLSLSKVALGRSAFGSVQLICSDFLSSVPDTCLLALVDTIFQFGSQKQDLNISLATTTLFWNLSDLLYDRTTEGTLAGFSDNLGSNSDVLDESLVQKLHTSAENESMPALWLILLRRVTAMATDTREEVRTGASHTIFRIFENHGEDLSSNEWQLCLGVIFLPMLCADARIYSSLLQSDNDEAFSTDALSRIKGQFVTTKLILEGTSKLFATYLPPIAQCSQFSQLWKTLFETFTTYLDYHLHEINASVFAAITTLLSAVPGWETIGMDAVQHTANIWATQFPKQESTIINSSNQEAFESYVRSLKEIYRLSEENVTTEVVHRIVSNLEKVVRLSDGSSYSSDIDSMTSLQRGVLGCLSMLRTDLKGIPSLILGLLARFIGLPFDAKTDKPSSAKPTFIALSKASMDLLQSSVAQHSSKDEVFNPSLLHALITLSLPIGKKYEWAAQGRAPVLWQKATSTLLVVIEHAVPRIFDVGLDEKTLVNYWDVIVRAGQGIASANVNAVLDSTPIFDDEDFDVTSLEKFNSLIIPALGSSAIPDSTRQYYTRTLFKNSVLHSVEAGEMPDLNTEPLKDLYKVRLGRTYNSEPRLRGVMAYHCLDSLISFVSIHDSSPQRVKLAQAAAPYLILRAALPLKAYIADQPLRGKHMPQPENERQELLFVLRKLRALEAEPKAIPEADGVKTETRRHLVRLFPLVIKAFEVAGRTSRPDEQLIEEARNILEAVGRDFKV